MRGYAPDSAEKTMDALRMTARIAKLRPLTGREPPASVGDLDEAVVMLNR